MRQQAFLVVRPQLSSSNPNFSEPRTRTADSDFYGWLTQQLLGRLKSTIPNLQTHLPKKVNSEKLGLGLDNPCRIVFLSLWMNKFLERVNDRHLWNPGVFSYAMIPRCRPNSRFFFFIVTSIVYAPNRFSGHTMGQVRTITKGCDNLRALWQCDGPPRSSYCCWCTPGTRRRSAPCPTVSNLGTTFEARADAQGQLV